MGASLETALSQSRAAVGGCGAISATGAGIGTLADALRDNRSALRAREAFAGKRYQTTVAGWVPEETIAQLATRDPDHADAHAFLMADAALREAGKNLPTVAAARRALVLSTTKADILAMERVFHRQPCSKTAHRHILPRLLADDLAAAHQVRGPVQCVSAACISGLLALQQGASLIQRGAADVVLVVGVDLVSHFVLAGFTSLKSLDAEGCRPFDSRRTGLSLGEGAGAVALVRRDLLPSPVWTIAGWGSSNDANHLTGPSRDGSGLVLAIKRALQRAADRDRTELTTSTPTAPARFTTTTWNRSPCAPCLARMFRHAVRAKAFLATRWARRVFSKPSCACWRRVPTRCPAHRACSNAIRSRLKPCSCDRNPPPGCAAC